MLKSQSPVFVTGFGDVIFKEVIKLNEVITMGPYPIRKTRVFLRRRNIDTDTYREKMM